MRGFVKWFDTAKGFGFVSPEDGGDDILLRGSILRNFGQTSVAADAEITMDVEESERGRHVVLIKELAAPAIELSELNPNLAEYRTQCADLPLTPARVKWFDTVKGFGFVNLFAQKEDIFVHVEILRAHGMLDLEQGQALSVKVIDGERGRMVAEVRSWDSAAS